MRKKMLILLMFLLYLCQLVNASAREQGTEDMDSASLKMQMPFMQNLGRTNIPAWNGVSLGKVYKNIELELIAHGNNVENFDVNLAKTVYLQSGYDCSYSAETGSTKLRGNMNIFTGKIIFDSGTFVLQ